MLCLCNDRALDNVFIERFWRALKYDQVYLKDYESPAEARGWVGSREWLHTLSEWS